jgi:hypothetical protein
MKSQKIIIAILGTFLVVSNLFWVYITFDNGITLTYTEDSLRHSTNSVNELLAIVPLVVKGEKREAIIGAAVKATKLEVEPFEKEGYVWVLDLGFQFNEAGSLVNVKTE